MAQHVFVVNDGSETFVDSFRGKKIAIRPNEKIKMQRREAIAFLSTMSPKDPHDPLRLVPKMLRIVPIDDYKEVEKFICNLDGKEFDTQEQLDDYLKSVANKTFEKDEVTGAIRRRKSVI